ncbi:hypothetical protein KBI52_02660 [Microvirga sp. HBU67558]|uniref:hypothetical protein n=1 Tax=Microvirga TaxID=186650 RepID=UPI001B35D182|nr:MULTISPECIES: hypothetical protein [unclassified Microvirga]MBQ0819146.1 hypothetical protein [Microvirga sp. HBU67558]
MSVLDKIKVVEWHPRPRQRKPVADQEEKRRTKFVTFLEEQKVLAQGGTLKKKSKKPPRHAFYEANGEWLFEPRYGTKLVTIKDGKALCVAGKTLDDVVKLIDTLVAATKAKELDKALAEAAERKAVGK